MKRIFLHIQKIYNCYTVVFWIAWGAVLVLFQVSGSSFDVKSEQLFFALHDFSSVIYWITIIPILPILWFFALIRSIGNKSRWYITFDLISGVVSIILWFQFFLTYIVGICGGA